MTNTNALSLNGAGVGGNGALVNSSATAATYAGLVSLAGSTSIVSNSGDIILFQFRHDRPPTARWIPLPWAAPTPAGVTCSRS